MYYELHRKREYLLGSTPWLFQPPTPSATISRWEELKNAS